MLSRADALAALDRATASTSSSIGGGITGAGVALDAASRGYSVALVERDDWAVGTSSRSSKMVHGGLRYLQNFDLGLVREALLERQLMVQLAPHLVYPTPFLVPTLGEDRRDRRIGIGLNMYDVMATTRVGRVAARAPGARAGRATTGRPTATARSPARRSLELVPALAGREPNSAYLFYDCQTDDVRLVLTVLGEAERFGAVFAQRRRGHRAARGRTARPTGVACADAESGETLRDRAPTTSSTRPASGPTASGPRRSSRRRTCRGSAPAAAPT